jgi:hypothetical protein
MVQHLPQMGQVSDDVLPLGPAIHAGPGRGHKTSDDGTGLSRGTNSAAYLVARLKRDKPELDRASESYGLLS